MKKILFLSYNYYPPFYSGKLIISEKRFQDLNPNKFQISVFTSGIKNKSNFQKDKNINIYRSPYIGEGKITKRINVMIFWVWSILRVFFVMNIDVIHYDECGWISIPLFPRLGYKMAWLHFIILVKIAKCKNIRTYFEHAISDSNGNFSPDKWKKQFLDEVDEIISVSHALFEAVKNVYPKKAKKIVYGIQEDIFKPLEEYQRNIFRNKHGADENTIILCFVGLVVKRKGFDLISEIFPKIVDEFSEVVLWVIGPQNLKESKHIHDDEVDSYKGKLSPVRKNVVFWGRIDDRMYLSEIIASTDIFLFPTRQEGFGLAPVEAMACGVPPIISKIPGVTDLANIDGVTGLYIKPDNVDELHQAIRKLIIDKTLREKMKIEARKQIEFNFTWKKHIKEWENLYNG